MNITPGLLSLLLALMAISAAIGVILPTSMATAGLYVLILIVCGGVLVYAYCSKCPCRVSGCGHILPGQLTRLLPKRKEAPYTWFDYVATAISIAAIVLLPFYWIVKTKPILVAYCLLLAVAGTIALVKGCPVCKNKYCCFYKQGKV